MHFVTIFFSNSFCSMFSRNDVLTDTGNITGVGNSTVVGVVVMKPGQNTSVEGDVVAEALEKTLQDDPRSNISGLALALVNTPTVSDDQLDEIVRVRLPGTNTSEVRFVLVCFISYIVQIDAINWPFSRTLTLGKSFRQVKTILVN